MTLDVQAKKPVLDQLLAALDGDDREEDLALIMAATTNPELSLEERVAQLERLVTRLRLVLGAALDLADDMTRRFPRPTHRERPSAPPIPAPPPLTPEERAAKRQRERRLRLLIP